MSETILCPKSVLPLCCVPPVSDRAQLVGPNCKAEPILFSAARAQNKRLLQMLIEAGADMAQLDEDGRSIMVRTHTRTYSHTQRNATQNTTTPAWKVTLTRVTHAVYLAQLSRTNTHNTTSVHASHARPHRTL